jgi:hypothetical protein
LRRAGIEAQIFHFALEEARICPQSVYQLCGFFQQVHRCQTRRRIRYGDG